MHVRIGADRRLFGFFWFVKLPGTWLFPNFWLHVTIGEGSLSSSRQIHLPEEFYICGRIRALIMQIWSSPAFIQLWIEVDFLQIQGLGDRIPGFKEVKVDNQGFRSGNWGSLSALRWSLQIGGRFRSYSQANWNSVFKLDLRYLGVLLPLFVNSPSRSILLSVVSGSKLFPWIGSLSLLYARSQMSSLFPQHLFLGSDILADGAATAVLQWSCIHCAALFVALSFSDPQMNSDFILLSEESTLLISIVHAIRYSSVIAFDSTIKVSSST